MRASLYRHNIIIQSKEQSRDTYGETDITWVDDFEVFAGITSIRGNQFFNAQQVQSAVTHKINMKYIELSNGDRIKPENARIKFNDRIFRIMYVINIDERDIELELMTVEEN